MKYDVIIIGAGPGGIFSAYELIQKRPDMKVAVFEAGHALENRKCPIDGDKIKTCIGCKSCSIMSGFGGAGAFSDGKYNITNDFGGTLYEYIGKKNALDLINTVFYLKDIYEHIANQKLKQKLMDYLVSLYLNAIFIGNLQKEKEYIHRDFVLKNASSFRNKIKSLLFFTSPRLYCYINSCDKK